MEIAIASFCISAVLCVINVSAFVIARKRESKTDTKEDINELTSIKESLLKVNMKLDQVCSTTTETRTDIKAIQNQFVEIDKRVVILERDMKTLWNKFDRLESDASTTRSNYQS